MTIKEKLQEVRKVVANGWTQEAYAKNANDNYISNDEKYGTAIDPTDPEAVKFCISGACAKVINYRVINNMFEPDPEEAYDYPGKYAEWFELIDALAENLPEFNSDETGTSLAGWNDAPERTQQDVLDLIDKTIASLK
jgi:hypothetical protein